jgi:hypothetical protein
MPQAPQNVTQLLIGWSKGDKEALDALVPLVYEELRRQASRYLRRERVGHTLQTTALIHEAYMRLIDQKNVHSASMSKVNPEHLPTTKFINNRIRMVSFPVKPIIIKHCDLF